MPVSATNLLVGAGSVWKAPFGTVEGAEATPLPAPVSPWVDYGGTDGGVTINVTREYFRLRVDQLVMSPGRRLTELDVELATALAEPTLENWKDALAEAAGTIVTAGAGATTTKGMDIDGPADPTDDPTYLAVLFRGKAPNGRKRHVVIRKALSIADDMESEYKKDDQTFIPVTFGAHWVSSSVKAVRVVDEAPTA